MKKLKTKREPRGLSRQSRAVSVALTSQLEFSQKRLQEKNQELGELKKANDNLQNMRLRQFDSMLIEKVDLIGRIARIDQRILALGLSPLVTASAQLEVNYTPLEA